MDLINDVKDPDLRALLERSLKAYIRTRSIVEKKVYRERIITFYSLWLTKEDVPKHEKRQKILLLKRLLLAIKK